MTDPTRRPGADAEPTEAIDLGDLAATQVVEDLQATSVRVSPDDFEATRVRSSPEDFEATRVQPSSLAEGSTVRMSNEGLADVHAAVDRALDTTDVAPLSQPTSLLPLHLQPISVPVSAHPISVQPVSGPPVSAPPQSFVAPSPPSRAPLITAIIGVVLLLVLAAFAIAVLTRG